MPLPLCLLWHKEISYGSSTLWSLLLFVDADWHAVLLLPTVQTCRRWATKGVGSVGLGGWWRGKNKKTRKKTIVCPNRLCAIMCQNNPGQSMASFAHMFEKALVKGASLKQKTHLSERVLLLPGLLLGDSHYTLRSRALPSGWLVSGFSSKTEEIEKNHVFSTSKENNCEVLDHLKRPDLREVTNPPACSYVSFRGTPGFWKHFSVYQTRFLGYPVCLIQRAKSQKKQEEG